MSARKKTSGQVSGWQIFQRVVLHRPEKGGVSPPEKKVRLAASVPPPPSDTAQSTTPELSLSSRTPLPLGPYTLNGGNVGKTVSQIIGAYQHFQSWIKVAHKYDVSLAVFRQWVADHQMDFVGHSADLTTLLKPKPAPSRKKRKTTLVSSQAAPRESGETEPVKIGSVGVSAEVKGRIDIYCSENKCTIEQLFHRVIDYSKMMAEANDIGISDGVFEMLVKQHGGVIIGSAVLEKVGSYCEKNGTTMEELFGKHDAGRTATVAKEVGITPVMVLLLANFYKTLPAPAAVSA